MAAASSLVAMDRHDGIGPWAVSMDYLRLRKTTVAYLVSLETGKSIRQIDSPPLPPSLKGYDLTSNVDDYSTLVAVQNSRHVLIIDITEPSSPPRLCLPRYGREARLSIVVMIEDQDVAIGMLAYRGGVMVYATPRMQKWSLLSHRTFADCISCKKDNCFYLLDARADKVQSLRFSPSFFNSSSQETLRAEEDLVVEDLTFDLLSIDHPYFSSEEEHNKGWSKQWDGRLFRTLDALFLVRWRLRDEWWIREQHPKKQFYVYKLMLDSDDDNNKRKRKRKKKWERVESLDGYAFVVQSLGHSIALSKRDFPGLTTDRIYITFDVPLDYDESYWVYDVTNGAFIHLHDMSFNNGPFMWMIPQTPQREKRKYKDLPQSEDTSVNQNGDPE